MSTPDSCPNGCDLKGAPIPEEYRDYYSPGTNHFSRVIGNYDWERDATVSWFCPDCEVTWPREEIPSGYDEGKFLEGLAYLFELPSPFED